MSNTVAILALQGAYQKHVEILDKLGIESRLVRKPAELEGCSALILPGGESTTISLLLQKNGLYEPIKDFADKHPVLGVCAGLIMMADAIDDRADDKRVTPLRLIPFTASRNFYGRQVHSFNADIKLSFDSKPFRAPFIRAPGIEKPSAEVNTLATYNDKAVMIGYNRHIALSFHPELTNDIRIHEYWLGDSFKL